jgi:hypothetical protein
LAGRLGRQTCFIKDGLKMAFKRLKTNIVSFKNRLKTRVALIELLDLSGIAVGNVGVPTCLNLGPGEFKNSY